MYDLKALQLKEIEMLQSIHEVCEKMGIKYVIMFGTLLGAVRHQGFIPWDDDIDICMTREDYDLFIEKAQEYLPDNLLIQHYSTEADCPNIYAKVRDNTTTFLHREHIDLDINHGVFIDIFPMERIQSSNQAILIEFYKRQLFTLLNNCYDKAYIDSIIRIPSKCIGYFVHYVLDKIVVRPSRAAFLRREDLRRKKLHQKGDDCMFNTVTPLKRTTAPYSLFTERALYNLEGKQFYGPKDYHAVLSGLYGDYMQLPPEEKRVTHKPLFVDLTRGLTKKEIKELGIVEEV